MPERDEEPEPFGGGLVPLGTLLLEAGPYIITAFALGAVIGQHIP
jgi:hypothetical protein